MAATDVIGREDEQQAIRGFLDRVAEGPCALVLSGEAGIGKTILWESGVEQAQQRFGRVLISRGIEAEASLSFAGLSSLLSDLLDEVGPSLVPPRRRALEVALLLVEPGDQPPDAHAIGLAVLDVFRALVQSGPLLVALDDVQWLDPASAGAIQIALRRLREEPAGLLATFRAAPELEDPFELERSVLAGRLQQLAVGPLSLGALHQLLAARLGLELTRPELTRVREATGGNPYFALELGHELVRTGTRPAPGRTLPMPESLQALLGGRLARLPGETLDVLLQAGALARPTVELVASAHGDRERVISALEAGVHEGVVELDDSRIRFAHPLLISMCYEQAPIWKRRAVHRALASAVSDVEERARHLALAAEGPDAEVASELDAAAALASARGATAAAGELYELGADLTPDDPGHTRRRRLQAARSFRLAGEPDRATAILRELLTEVRSGSERADALFELALTFRADNRETIELCNEALAEAAGDDIRSARILALRSLYRLLVADVNAALSDARAALGNAERLGDPVLLATAIGRVGHAETYTTEITPGLLERGAEIEQRLGLGLERSSPQFHLGRLSMRLGDLDRARTIMEQVAVAAAARGDEVTRVIGLFYSSIIEWFAGRLPQALEHASSAHEAGEQAQFALNSVWAGRIQALVEADLGRIDRARSIAQEGLVLSQSVGTEVFTLQILGVLGRLELLLDNLEGAGGYLREVPEQLLERGVNDPIQPLWADAIETLIALGELDQAQDYLEAYEANARRLGSPWALAATARCNGLRLAAAGDSQAALAAFDSALAMLNGFAFPLERGRTLLCLGMVRRQSQQKKAAREALGQALAVFEELGARPWAERARAELKRISGRAPASEELTESERRVAELAARGRTNKEIAAELYMGVSTVEAHLSRVYRKLGVRRAGLRARLGVPFDSGAEGVVSG